MKFEYPITADYIRDWKPIHALREFGANALDAEAQYGARAIITYEAKRKALLFKNEGVTLSRDALLLGGTDKASRGDTIGTYGEGMKMGFLVMSREGFVITVRNGLNEKWVPRIEHSEKWAAKVLQLDVTAVKRQVETFEIEILGVDMDLWVALQETFLKLKPAESELRLSTGAVLVDSEMVGRIYCKGVFVMHKPNYEYGYDFNGLALNRDRRFVDDIDPHIAAIWSELVGGRPDKLAELYRMLDQGTPEGTALKFSATSALSSALAEEFRSRHPDALIARNTDEAAKFEHYGIKAVVPGQALYYVLSSEITTFDRFRREHRYDVTRTYTTDELAPAERDNYNNAIALLHRAGVVGENELRVSVVDFDDPKLGGLHDNEQIKIARRVLKSFGKTVTHLIHEFSHDRGMDGEKSHVEAIEEATAAVLDAAVFTR